MIKLLFCGDVFMANTLFTKSIGLGAKVCELLNDEKIDNIFSLSKNCDYSFCNLESPLTNDKEKAKNSSFIGYSIIPRLLANSKINIVSIGNNHILDHGVDIFEETTNILERNGLFYVGKYENGLSNICILKKNDVKIGYAAFNGVDLHKINNPNIFAELNESTVKLVLEKMISLGVNIKVLSFHWGDEYITIPSSYQIKLGHFAIENGANIIVGHHPHVVQPIEYYKNGLIMYSLGNCIFDFLQSKQFKEGIIVEVSIDESLKIGYQRFPIQLKRTGYFSFRLNENKSENFFENILNVHYDNEIKYNKYYYKMLKKNRFFERIRMKIHLLKVILISNYPDNIYILWNCLSIYSKILQK